MSREPVIAITAGDVRGIGPEVILKALTRHDWRGVRFRIIDPAGAVAYWARRLSISVSWPTVRSLAERQVENDVIVYRTSADLPEFDGNATAARCGEWAMQAVEQAVKWALRDQVQAVVTAPISKEAIAAAGYTVPGHTEYLAQLCAAPQPVMMLVAGDMRVALVTTHIPLQAVPAAVTREAVERCLQVVHHELVSRFGIERPVIAVAGLNPHAGESGRFGREEEILIAPAVAAAKKQGMLVEGPFPADALFSRIRMQRNFDAIVAMYHDQGLIPLKLVAGGRGVNYTCGLPIVRTSPDHGTAMDIAGRGTADETSMVEAIRLAVELAQKRNPG